jgi:hypothetical protein
LSKVRADIDPAAMATALWGMFNGVLALVLNGLCPLPIGGKRGNSFRS